MGRNGHTRISAACTTILRPRVFEQFLYSIEDQHARTQPIDNLISSPHCHSIASNIRSPHDEINVLETDRKITGENLVDSGLPVATRSE